MPRASSCHFRSDTLPASRRSVVVTEETSDGTGLQLAGDRGIVLTLREDVSVGTARRIAHVLNDTVEDVTLVAG